MLHRLAAAALAAGSLTAIHASPVMAQQECGQVMIAEMNWASAGVTAQLDRLILGAGLGCDIEMVTGDTVPTFTSMVEKGSPDVAPEFWTNAVADQLEAAVKDGKLVIAGNVLKDGGVEGWWIPAYFAKEHPEIRTVADALAHPELFPDPENPGRAGIVGCPAGWTCQAVTENLFRARKASEKGFDLIDPGSSAGLDGSLSAAYLREAPWLGYYWAPTALLGKYPMVMLDPGVKHDPAEIQRCTSVPNCPDPKDNDYARARVSTIVTADFAARDGSAPAMAYFAKRSWDNDTVGKLLAWQEDNQASNEDTARHFLKEDEELWTQWVTPEQADQVRAAL